MGNFHCIQPLPRTPGEHFLPRLPGLTQLSFELEAAAWASAMRLHTHPWLMGILGFARHKDRNVIPSLTPKAQLKGVLLALFPKQPLSQEPGPEMGI